jgi:HEAT repeat protein
MIRSAIEYAFSDFQCEELLNHFDDWPDAHLYAYGKMVRIADRNHIEFIENQSKSQFDHKRARAIKAIRFLGSDGRLGQVAMEALKDISDAVRIEAIYTIAPGLSRGDANAFLDPMLEDQDANVRVAANFAISQIKDTP